ncbi:hypothetical protein Ahy_A05g025100 isoform B [Arachis hypogaea]|uniref:Uncharacterized protein n=1 Tax=Arachis hypogaea TaxID=3818 RepID=A0A445D8B1_ARAHY|nr:hypothetical protein Ahy_A05g025100 isoform B [Arachis hypogaea]
MRLFRITLDSAIKGVRTHLIRTTSPFSYPTKSQRKRPRFAPTKTRAEYLADGGRSGKTISFGWSCSYSRGSSMTSGFVSGSNYAVHLMRSPSDASRACGGSRACD